MSLRNKILGFIKKLFEIIKKIFTLNIATLIFGAIFIYMLITVLLYVTSTHVTSYQVTAGPLAKNPVCTALAVRDEQIVTAEVPGYIRYYAREGMKVRKNGNVYALSDTQNAGANVSLTKEQLEELRSRMSDFSNSFSGNDFYSTYSFKYELQGMILQLAGVSTKAPAAEVEGQNDEEELTESGDVIVEGSGSLTFGNQTVHTAPEAGLVIYSIDGYEEKEIEELTEEDFDQKSYDQQDLLSRQEVKTGDPVYKLVKNENWSIMVPLTDKLAASLEDRTSIKVKFLRDGESQTGQLSIVNIGDQKTARIDFKNGMARYASDRFLSVELVTNTQSGLKIPMSSIVTKEFYLVPASFITKGDNNDEAGFIKQTTSKDNTAATEFVSAVIYKITGEETDADNSEDSSGQEESYCYVDKETFKDGDILHKPDSSETFEIGEIDYLEGVYSMNKGYAVFRQIDIIDQNEEYCIVKSDTQYGLEQFDRIVLNGESVKEEDILTGK